MNPDIFNDPDFQAGRDDEKKLHQQRLQNHLNDAQSLISLAFSELDGFVEWCNTIKRNAQERDLESDTVAGALDFAIRTLRDLQDVSRLSLDVERLADTLQMTVKRMDYDVEIGGAINADRVARVEESQAFFAAKGYDNDPF